MSAPPAVSDQAAENNQRLFRRYARVFSGTDLASYKQHAHKLSVWLSDHKAYYVTARPEIIKLLLVAQGTLRRSLGISEEFSVPFNIHDYPPNPFALPYAQLVKAILPYQHMFIEPSLAAHIQALQNTIADHAGNIGQANNQPLLQSSFPPSEHVHPPDNSGPPAAFPSNSLPFDDPDIQIIENPNLVPSAPISMQNAPQPSAVSKLSNAAAPVRRVKTRKALDLAALAQIDTQGIPKKQASKDTVLGDAQSPSQPAVLDQPTLPTTTGNETMVENQSQPINAENAENAENPVILEYAQIMEQAGPTGSHDHDQQMVVISPDTQGESQNLVEEHTTPPQGPQTTPERADILKGNTIGHHDDDMDTTMVETTQEKILNCEPSETITISAENLSVERETQIPQPFFSSITQPDPSIVFTSEMRVVANEKGKKESSYIHMKFDIPETDFQLVLAWVARSNSQSIEKIQSSVCISLGCYLTADLLKHSGEDGRNTFEKEVFRSRSAWPVGGGLVMNVELAGNRQTLPLAPPLEVTPDNLVDISNFLRIGTNDFELRQYQDLGQYTFVLHAHYPTRAQLMQVEEQWQKNREWEEWIQYMSRPLKIPLRPTA